MHGSALCNKAGAFIRKKLKCKFRKILNDSTFYFIFLIRSLENYFPRYIISHYCFSDNIMRFLSDGCILRFQYFVVYIPRFILRISVFEKYFIRVCSFFFNMLLHCLLCAIFESYQIRFPFKNKFYFQNKLPVSLFLISLR